MKIRCTVCGYQYSYEEMRQILAKSAGTSPLADCTGDTASCQLK